MLLLLLLLLLLVFRCLSSRNRLRYAYALRVTDAIREHSAVAILKKPNVRTPQ